MSRVIKNVDLLRKANLTTDADFGGVGQAPLSVEQVEQFIELMAEPQVMLPDVRTVMHSSSKWQESILDFDGRIARPGVECNRLDANDRVKPTTGIVEISTVLVRGEVPVSDEVFEDNVAREGFVGSLERTIASHFGADIEELFIAGDTTSADSYLALQDGWLQLAQNTGGNVVNATTIGQDYQEVFKQLLVAVPDRFKRDAANWRYYVPQRLVEKYRDILADRGTALGDISLTGNNELRYQGILILGVPLFPITAGTPDTSFALLANRNNLYAGWRRMMSFETDRLAREGCTSFVVTARVNSQIAVPEATAIATNVNVEP